MSTFEQARSNLKMQDAALAALETIQGLTGVGGDKAASALKVIRSIIGTLHSGFDGRLSAETVLAEIKAFDRVLDASDHAIDKRIDEEFK